MGAGLICSGYIFIGSGLHLEAVHSLTGLRDIDLIVVLHTKFSPLLSSDENTFRRKHFLFRNHSLTKVEISMNGEWRKDWQQMESRIRLSFPKR